MNLKTFNLAYLVIFIVISFSFFTINSNVISADENIVEDIRFTSMIPEGIQFAIDVSDVSLIEDIQVKFKIDGRKTFQYEYVEIPEDLSLLTLTYFFSTSKSDRYIPPGSFITYYFELFFKDGTKFRTEQKKDVILDSRFEWNKVSGEVVDIYFHGPVGRRANKLLEACEKTVTQMSILLGVTEKKPISVIMYNNYSEMFDVVVKKSETQAGSLITEGQAFATENVVLVDGGSRSALGVSTHEITHVIVARASEDSYLGVPLWLNEGLAELANIEQDAGYDRYLEWAIDTGRILPFSSLNRFPGNPNLTLVAYGQSKSFVEFLINEFPVGSMSKLMQNISEKKSINDSFKDTYGKDLNEIENLWRKKLGIVLVLSEDTKESPEENLQSNQDIDSLNEEDDSPLSRSNGSCGGSTMGFEFYSFGVLLLAFFVKRFYFNRRKRN